MFCRGKYPSIFRRDIIFIFFLFFCTASAMSFTASISEKDTTKSDSAKAVWKSKCKGNIDLTHISYTNWAQGGQNLISWNARLDGSYNRTGGKWDFSFNHSLIFGQMKAEKENTKTTVDKIDADAIVSIKTNKYVNPYFGASLLTQFTKGYDYKKEPPEQKSNFWDPAYLTQSLGARITLNDKFSSHLGIGFKQTITNRFNQYSNNPKTDDVEKIKFETGVESRTNLDVKIFEYFNIRSRLNLFSTLEKLNEISMEWDTLFSIRLTKYLAANFNMLMRYDGDVIDKIQVRETTSFGITCSFI